MGRERANAFLDSEERTGLLGERNRLLDPNRSVEVSSASFIEAPEVYKSRWRSIRVLYLIMFLSSISFTVTLSSIWPYLQLVDPNATASFLGWVVASYSLGQLVASPLFGVWSTWRKTSREPIIVTLIISTLANVMYAYVESIPNGRAYFLLGCRALIGFGAGNIAVLRSYISGATTLKERTPTMANLSIFQSLGFILGPGFQAALVPVGYPGPVHVPAFHFDLYTAPAFISAIVGVVGILLLIFVFKEHRVIDDSELNIQASENDDDPPDYKPDYLAIISTIVIFFVVLFIFTIYETIGTPLTMDMYAWTKSKATLYQGIFLVTGGVVAVGVFVGVKVLAKRINERYILLGGFVLCLMGFIVYLPWGNKFPDRTITGIVQATTVKPNVSESLSKDVFDQSQYSFHQPSQMNGARDLSSGPLSSALRSSDLNNAKLDLGDHSTVAPLQDWSNIRKDYSTVGLLPQTTEPSGNATNTTVEPVGCPSFYDWCGYVPQIRLPQYIAGTFLIVVGYPATNVMCYTLFSKILGPQRQGFWMGWLAASGSLARTVGPVFVSQVYDAYGPRVTFTVSAGVVVLVIVGIIVVFRRLVPFKYSNTVREP